MATSSGQGIDRMQLIGLVLIGLIFAGYMVYTSYTSQDAAKNRPQTASADSSGLAKQAGAANSNQAAMNSTSASASTANSSSATLQQPAAAQTNRYGAVFEPFVSGTQQLYTIETPLIKALYSSRGAVLRQWHLNKYNIWYGDPVQMISGMNGKGELGLMFTSHEGKEIDTRNLYFAVETSKPSQNGAIKLGEQDSVVFTARMNLANGASIVKTMTFYGNRYEVGLDVLLVGMDNVIANRRYELAWKDGVQYQERNSVDESNAAKAMLSQNRSIEELDASDVGTPVQTNGSGVIDYAAIKARYFVAAILPKQLSGEASVYLDGQRRAAANEGAIESYGMTFRLPYNNMNKADKFTVYIGPVDYDVVKNYGLEATVDFGVRFVVRPIAEYVLFPLLQFLHRFIPNYGWAIIAFSLLMRLIMHPLMISQMKSSQKMQLLAPEMTKIRDKYKDDPQQQQAETMKLYSEYGINPAGGCLPLLLQMPIFIALNAALGVIALRQQPFMLWIHDLSVPDEILRLPFKIPLMNIDVIAGIALISALITVVQSSMTVTDPNQKAMVYLMPVMFIFIFSSFASGLSLYYAVFNIIGVVQQVYMNKFSKKKPTLADLKKMPKKEGWLQKKMKEAQEIAASQGRPLHGQSAPRSQKEQNNKRK